MPLSIARPPSRKTILFVDDDEAMRAAVYYAFSPCYRVVLAHDGLDGYAKASAPPPPDIVLSDIAPPRLDGLEMAVRLRENKALRSVPILFVAAEIRVQSIVCGRHGSSFACLPKSTHLFVLRKKVEAALAARLELARTPEVAALPVSDFARIAV